MADIINIYEKLQKMRVALQQKNLKKSGKNKFAGYDYYELADILPPINELQAEYKTCSFVKFNKEEAVLTIVNAEKPEEKIEFTSPMAELTLKGTHPIQNLGGVETYQRRYLYMVAWEIVENDFFDSVQGKTQHQPKKKLISDTTAQAINEKIKHYSEKTGMQFKEITKELEQLTHKSMSVIGEGDARLIIEYLSGKIAKLEVSHDER